jgi:hypothetical protein
VTVIVQFKHIRAAKLCARGARAWFSKYGFSWDEFVAKGKSADELEATGDALAFRVTEIARREASRGGR